MQTVRYQQEHAGFSENSTALSDLADHFRRGLPPFKNEPTVACAGLPTSWWYPNYHADDYSETRSEQQEREHHNQIAVKLCKSCLHCDECAQWALDHNEHGIWGATFEGTRVKIRKIQGIPKPIPREFAT